MEPPKYIRKYEQLERSYLRIARLYNCQIMNQEGEDSFHSPKDVVQNFFQICYELKESLRFDPSSPPHFSANKGAFIENFCNSDPFVSLSLDIANQEKHVVLSKPKTNRKIGIINTGIHISSPIGSANRTELTIEIDGKKEDCLNLAGNILASWNKFWADNKL